MFSSRLSHAGLLYGPILLGLAAVLVGCEDNIVHDRAVDIPFTMYGLLSPDLDTQSVRLYVPEAVPSLGSPEPLDAEVYSVDMESGTRHIWHDSLVTETNGQYGHIFWYPFRVEPGREYRIAAVRPSDGAMSFTDIMIPPPVTVHIDETKAPLLQIFVEGGGFRLLSPEALYDVSRPIPHPETGQFQPVLRYQIEYAGTERRTETGWSVTFNMIVDAFEVNALYNGAICQAPCGGNCAVDYVFLEHIGIRVIVGNSDWDVPGGILDPNIISDPELLTNVENGLGFIGAGYELVKELTPSRETVESACFRYGL